MIKPTMGIVADAQKEASMFAGTGDLQEWADAIVVSKCTGLTLPQVRQLPYRTNLKIKDHLYEDDPVSTTLRVSASEPPWELTCCNCKCGCMLVCVDHIDDPHTEECYPLLKMRRIITDDVIYGSTDNGMDVIKVFTRISEKSESQIRDLAHYHYWALRMAITRSMNDPLWPGEELGLETLVALGLSLEFESSNSSTTSPSMDSEITLS